MALNPLRKTLGPLGIRGAETSSAFSTEAEAGLARFRARRDELQRNVRRGELTPKVARRLAAETAAEIRQALTNQAAGFSAVPRSFLDRLAEVASTRDRSRDSASLEALQRETNRLLRESLIEQQLRNREEEFRGQAYARPVAGGSPAPSLDGLLRFHETATLARDEAAREWARRQLEAYRPMAPDPDDQRQIDLACDRPDRVNPRLVGRYLEQLEGGASDELEAFAEHAIAAHDANACVAAFMLAREAPEGPSIGWVRRVLNGLDHFPDAALITLRAWEAEARAEESEVARAEADRIALIIDAEAAMPALQAPSEADLERASRFEGMPLATPGEPIGLAFGRRGFTAEEFSALEATTPDGDDASPDQPSHA
ncbi:hypothetical protein AB1L88_06210 [Tautonia sp. JC769]|uniref:hypothetical protein n=1 Tax=Tautonia sp. JC769 TaxID=3232135 RepID=UPI00345B3CE8